ncbi:hypothetical protein RI103_16075 [Paraburkholderia sp. FT54]|uniref:hypothetical protein n=1 Tax=Paraburkholderia sp. FT54 TaxID=3074437 RepID=UPI002877902B|nr:hypothetical protein [Paraburkholderia sp. FT54]WNC89185.1 hypothetical protein RI103_16075 [Paraburkholderia sp. FT54]
MQIKTYTVLTLLVFSSAAVAWQPLIYPIRSQSPYQRSIDAAMCYATANKQTKVNITREPQIPPRKPAATKTSSTGAPSRPPLPPSTFSSAPIGASMPAAAAEPGASAPAATTAATVKGASATTAASAPPAGTTTTAATAASATSAGNAASETAAASAAQMAAASSVKLPPLPAPEPPMTQYWAAYGACMQARGYVVAQ